MNGMEINIGRIITLGVPSFVFVFSMTLIIGAFLLPLLRKLAIGQQVRDDGPKSHIVKSGTPTFGGLMFLIPLVVMGTIFPLFPLFKPFNIHGAVSPLTVTAWFVALIGAVGFIDDYIKVKIRKSGLSALVKSILLLVAITGFTLYYLYFSEITPTILIPFMDLSSGGTPAGIIAGNTIEITGAWKILYGLFVALVLYVTSNSVNITDGVDGLATSVTALIGLTLGLMGVSLNTVYASSSSMLAFAVAGGCIAFFFYNRHPAKLFMGDTGSQALGASVAAASILMGIPWIIIPIGIVYVMESLSVLIQVFYFKRTKKRVFRMAPLHHHFELGGWSEWKVIGVFCLVTLLGCLAGLFLVL